METDSAQLNIIYFSNGNEFGMWVLGSGITGINSVPALRSPYIYRNMASTSTH